MTFDELKLEAKKLGYRLEKIQEPITLLPCPICGKKRTSEWYQHSKIDKKKWIAIQEMQ